MTNSSKQLILQAEATLCGGEIGSSDESRVELSLCRVCPTRSSGYLSLLDGVGRRVKVTVEVIDDRPEWDKPDGK